jgi:hypothetical protein
VLLKLVEIEGNQLQGLHASWRGNIFFAYLVGFCGLLRIVDSVR